MVLSPDAFRQIDSGPATQPHSACARHEQGRVLAAQVLMYPNLVMAVSEDRQVVTPRLPQVHRLVTVGQPDP
jgi:hypothetical protein